MEAGWRGGSMGRTVPTYRLHTEAIINQWNDYPVATMFLSILLEMQKEIREQGEAREAESRGRNAAPGRTPSAGRLDPEDTAHSETRDRVEPPNPEPL